jgi:hypothetical protein
MFSARDWARRRDGWAMGKDQRHKEAAMDLRVGTRDARGRVLEEGDEIIVSVAGPIYYRVASITPALDPGLPADMLTLVIRADIKFLAQRGKVNPEFIRVRTAEEMRAWVAAQQPQDGKAGGSSLIDTGLDRTSDR